MTAPEYRMCGSKDGHSVHEYEHNGKTYRCPGAAPGGRGLRFRL